MGLFSPNVLGKSVLIAMAIISTAWDCRLCLRTKSSLQRTAAPLPSDVGLNESEKVRERERERERNRLVKTQHHTNIGVLLMVHVPYENFVFLSKCTHL